VLLSRRIAALCFFLRLTKNFCFLILCLEVYILYKVPPPIPRLCVGPRRTQLHTGVLKSRSRLRPSAATLTTLFFIRRMSRKSVLGAPSTAQAGFSRRSSSQVHVRRFPSQSPLPSCVTGPRPVRCSPPVSTFHAFVIVGFRRDCFWNVTAPGRRVAFFFQITEDSS